MLNMVSVQAFAISFLIGVSQLLWLPKLQIVWLLPIALILSITLFSKINKNIRSISIIMGLCLGFVYAIIVGINVKSYQLKGVPDSYINIIGKVSNLPIIKNDKVKFSFEISEIQENIHLKKILVSWYNSNEKVVAGQIWNLNLKLKPIHGYKNPGSFDYSKWLFRQGYDATATVKKAALLAESSADISSKVHLFRAKIATIIDNNFHSTRVQALIKALTIGDKSQISYQDSQLFQTTGTAHLIAISGLHIGLIAFVGILFGRILFFVFANERFNRFKYEAIFAIGFAMIYALLAGLSIPTIRALIMVTVFSVAHASKQQIGRWQTWSIAMLMVLLIDPFGVLDIGFWFSFGAVAVLMFAFNGRNNKGAKAIAFIKAQVVILIGLMPLMVIVFKQINLLTPFVNILVLPLASLLLIPLTFASMFVYTFSDAMAEFLFYLVEKLAVYLFMILDYMQKFDFLSIGVKNINSYTVTALVIAMFILLLPKLFRWRFLALILFIPLFLKKQGHLQYNEFQINVLDVGQGLSVVVSTKNHSLVYDTGAKYDTGFSLATSVLIPFLQHQGMETVDKLILSHKDNDHAGGVEELISSFPDMQVLDVMGDYSDCQFPSSWDWDGVHFSIYSPFELLPYLGNNSSCVLKISSKNGSILLTGDIEEPVEYRLTKKFPHHIKSDVLLVPHHGSRTSSSKAFIKLVAPKVAVNSSGFANQFNHPHPLIKQLYLDQGIIFYDTQTKGMIKLVFKDHDIKIQQYADVYPHFWDTNIE